MPITVGSLVAAGIGPTQARAFEVPLQQVCEIFEINTPRRQAAFVGEYGYESTKFTHLEEDLYYVDAERAATKIFRSVFDLNHDRVISPEEIALARPYMRAPQKLANRVYANRNGNGDEASGDGWNYRGRGLPMLTGRANYTAAALELHEPFIDQPDLVATPGDAVLVAGWFWRRGRCNGLADVGDIDGITRAINGPAMAGAQERRDFYARALQAFR